MSSTFTATMSGDSRYSIKLTLTYTGYNNDGDAVYNYALTATKSSGTGYWTTNTNNPVRVTIDGTNVVNTTKAYDFDTSPNDQAKTITLASGTVNIPYNGSTTRNVAVSGYFSDANNSLGSATASGTLALPEDESGGSTQTFVKGVFIKINGEWIPVIANEIVS